MDISFDSRDIKRLVVFGDSWSWGHGIEKNEAYEEVALPDRFTHHLRGLNSWPRWVAQPNDWLLVNMSVCGICNVGIKHEIQQSLQHLETGSDLVLVMWSYPYRHHLWLEQIDKKDILLQNILAQAVDMLQGHTYYFFNSFFPTFRLEPNILDKVDLGRFLDPHSCPIDAMIQHEQDNDVSVWGYDRRKSNMDQEQFRTGGYHPNLLGHKIMAHWVSKQLAAVDRAQSRTG